MFAAHNEAKVSNLLIALANTKRDQSPSTPAYLTKMQGYADDLAAAGRPLLVKELVAYILAGLGPGYNSVVAALGVVTTLISLSMLYSQLDSFDQRQDMLHGAPTGEFETSANATSRQRRSRNNYSGKPCYDRGDRQDDRRDDRKDPRRDDRPHQHGRGGGRAPSGGGRGRGRERRRCTSPWVDVTCQICNKEGHAAKDCWWRFEDDDDDSFGDKEGNAASYGVDTNWYSDSGATHHITSELNNMTVRDNYRGHDKVNTANGQGHAEHSV